MVVKGKGVQREVAFLTRILYVLMREAVMVKWNSRCL